MKLHAETDGAGPALVLLHGFTGSATSWRAERAALAARFTVIAVDLPGHGASPTPASPDAARLPQVADALADVLDRVGVATADWLGYSLGGRVALHVALEHPGCVRRLILESCSPGIDDPTERTQRAQADAALAESIERDGLEPFVDRWMAQPLFASQARLPVAVRERERQGRLRGSAAGYAAALRAMGVGTQVSLWGRLGEIAAPTLLLAGEADPRYRRIAGEMAERLTDARSVVVPGAGHTIHLEEPAAFLAAVTRFLGEPSRPLEPHAARPS